MALGVGVSAETLPRPLTLGRPTNPLLSIRVAPAPLTLHLVFYLRNLRLRYTKAYLGEYFWFCQGISRNFISHLYFPVLHVEIRENINGLQQYTNYNNMLLYVAYLGEHLQTNIYMIFVLICRIEYVPERMTQLHVASCMFISPRIILRP